MADAATLDTTLDTALPEALRARLDTLSGFEGALLLREGAEGVALALRRPTGLVLRPAAFWISPGAADAEATARRSPRGWRRRRTRPGCSPCVPRRRMRPGSTPPGCASWASRRSRYPMPNAGSATTRRAAPCRSTRRPPPSPAAPPRC
ncbi:hypothetical protein [Teichococcus aestuarii]|uniref:hypothetical protein n=1 Tax=Teichococcus aestuarii TaxID=568898 RepID=UPI00360F1D2C